MSDFLKSAMGYFNPGPNGQSENDFVGQTVEVGSVKLRVKRVIAEGLYMKMVWYIGTFCILMLSVSTPSSTHIRNIILAKFYHQTQ